jgi:hypothetical protein
MARRRCTVATTHKAKNRSLGQYQRLGIFSVWAGHDQASSQEAFPQHTRRRLVDTSSVGRKDDAIIDRALDADQAIPDIGDTASGGSRQRRL